MTAMDMSSSDIDSARQWLQQEHDAAGTDDHKALNVFEAGLRALEREREACGMGQMTARGLLEVLAVAVDMGERWAEVDSDTVEDTDLPEQPLEVTAEDAACVLRDFTPEPNQFADLPDEVLACAVHLCIQSRTEEWRRLVEKEKRKKARLG